MMQELMTVAAFEELIDLHGPDPEFWPVADRPGAALLLAQSEPARALMAQAKLAEHALTAMPLDRASAELRRAILAIPAVTAGQGRAQPRPTHSLPGIRWRGRASAGRVPVLAGSGGRTAWAGGIPAALVSGMAAVVVGIVLGVHGVSPLVLSANDARAAATTEYMKAMTEIDTELGQ
ncbi:hypothetical protein [Nitrospirillum iridis]|uniref:Uncharacterized protein n=1 Tax=Nitrospirillum iridis TaxID=765888 RepID=A0A7X0AX13_9PROT|nr:hypothetical protein [Nitrospirillum iridis]MBB6251692.1 hypothetical protein [Nitrospirillum iridis]